MKGSEALDFFLNEEGTEGTEEVKVKVSIEDVMAKLSEVAIMLSSLIPEEATVVEEETVEEETVEEETVEEKDKGEVV